MYKKLVLIFVLGLISTPAAGAVRIGCVRSLVPAEIISKETLSEQGSRLLLSLNDSNKVDTTSLRTEFKFTVDSSELNAILDPIKETMGERMVRREKVKPDTVNMTKTRYLNPLHYYYKDKGKEYFGSVRIRIRKYSSFNLKTKMVSNAGFTRDKSFLEFKISNPNFENVVNKHRMMVFDADIDDFIKNNGSQASINKLIKNAMIIDQNISNPNFITSSKIIKKFLSNLNKELNEPIAEQKTLMYQRSAYSIFIPPQKGIDVDGQTLDIQITIDNSIEAFANTGEKIGQYADNLNVIEVKVPLHVSEFTPATLKTYPQLKVIRNLLTSLSESAQDGFLINHGKFHHSQKGVLVY